jgi:hypothetical protein
MRHIRMVEQGGVMIIRESDDGETSRDLACRLWTTAWALARADGSQPLGLVEALCRAHCCKRVLGCEYDTDTEASLRETFQNYRRNAVSFEKAQTAKQDIKTEANP